MVRLMRVLVLGAGFGGLTVATRLSEEFGDAADVVLVDDSKTFVFGFSKLDVMFGHSTAEQVSHSYDRIDKPGVRFVDATVTRIDPLAKRVETSAGSYDADILVVALGANLHPDATPGLVEGGHEFYSEAGAFAIRDVLAGFTGGGVVFGVTSTPFKCPPAPSEAALLMDEFLRERGLRDSSSITLVMPLVIPIPPSPDASRAVLDAFAERDISWRPQTLVSGLDPDRKVALLNNGEEMPYDLFLGVPVHRVPAVVEECGLAVDGWVPVDRNTLETSFADVYAVGDCTSVGTAKAGVFAEGQAAIVAERIAAGIRNETAGPEYDGRGTCYLEFGGGNVATVDVTFAVEGTRPGPLRGPSADVAAEKEAFGRTRVQRWFGG
jgi:sulfide:quinone oxidoreductase